MIINVQLITKEILTKPKSKIDAKRIANDPGKYTALAIPSAAKACRAKKVWVAVKREFFQKGAKIPLKIEATE